ncbi:DinB family protein [Rossellomorea vietnamensis]|uniref:DinB family protein n=1 Tax=Rossellomorea vietnamensis TaxID=218284 RepID=UPI00077CB099|nr:DinB family protein [Rossellomorea vietnamensis]OXS59579.1 damage-inducible protein DinB [Bacillus sp. DSM 27956]PRX76104.1 DinB family protein [Bacillus sp. V-88]SLK23151.1 DinB superfamily protein [Bacillus sp. V-88]
MISKPETNEYPPYYKEYVNNVPDGELLQILDDQQKETKELLKDLSEETAEYQYAPGKWTIKEVIGHITDTERIMCYRLLSIARGEKGMLPGYTDDDYVKRGQFNRFSLSDLLHHQALVRQHTILLLSSLDEEAMRQRGNANGSEVTALAIAYIIAGHEIHHRRLIKDRYLRDALTNSDNDLKG